MSILIKNILLDQQILDIYIEGNSIKKIGKNITNAADKIIDGKNKAAIPGMVNGHTHAAMTLMRGYADDMHLMPWLEQKIWPLESKLTEEDVYWGTKLACLEMIKTGTSLFFDMYHHFPASLKAIEEMGLRAVLTSACFDFDQPQMAEDYKQTVIKQMKLMQGHSNRIQYALGPHAIYTVSTDLIKWVNDFSKDNGLRIQTHLSETQSEVDNSIQKYGKRPAEYLDSIGFLTSNVSLAHCIHLSDDDIKRLADNGCQVIHNPASNMKLASGNKFRFSDLKNAGVPICIGTDGTASGNNLDMFEAMKLASLNGKVAWEDPTIWNANETFEAATEIAETLTGFKTGKIKEGYLADISLVNLNVPEMVPNFNLISNLVYSANGNVVDTLICDGKLLMENRKVEEEETILFNANKTAYNVVSRLKEA
ncbi:MAG: amidohydrolase [Prolixibacteraceae bacterium]|nr:amidohydrolase [Prolixibacteraceae bacterium]